MRTAKLSVLMPAYNAAPFIGEAIASVLNQSFTEFELIVVNDGSTDETEAVVRSFTDGRIVLINQANGGIASALNKGLAAAAAPLIARFDADDVCYPHRLARQYQWMTTNPACVIAGSAADCIDESGGFVFTNQPPAFTDAAIKAVSKTHCPFIHSSVVYKKDAVLKHGGYNRHAHSFEDHLLWQSVLTEGEAANVPEPLIKVRLNPASVTVDERWRPRAFHRLKKQALAEARITPQQGEALQKILAAQNNASLKQGAYHALLSKKFLWNNYQPQKARENLERVIARHPLHWKSYCLYGLSFLPGSLVQTTYRLLKKEAGSLALNKISLRNTHPQPAAKSNGIGND